MKTHVGPYRIEEQLGRGGMGVVYRGTHEHLRRQVAIKELAPELTRQPEFKERFFAEARTQARLQHPNIVTVFDLIEEQGDFFIVMELVAGRSLDALLAEREGRGLGLGEAVGIFSQFLSALDYAHSEGVIHRDVKPSNVLLTPDGRVKLMDFGIALLVGDKRLTASQASIGTPVYMSPEQILKPREMDHRTDIYSAAIVFHEMLAGAPPFDAESLFEISKLQVEAPPPDLSAQNPAVPAAVARVVERALAKSPDERFMSAGEMLRALRDAVSATGAPAFPPDVLTAPRPVAVPPPLSRPLPPTAAAVAAPTPVGTGVRRGPNWKVLAPAGVALAIVVAAALGLWRYFGAPSTAAPAAEPPAVAAPVTAPAAPSPAPGPPAAPQQAPSMAATVPEPAPEVRRPVPAPAPEPKRPAPSPRPGDAEVEQQTRRAEVARVRETLRQGIDGVQGDLTAQRFTAARERLNQLQEAAVPYRADLIDEVARLRALDQEITSTQIAVRTAALTDEQEKQKWQRRLDEIQGLLQDKSYPEAKKMAAKLANESGVPEGIADRARELSVQADQALKKIFGDTQIKTHDAVVKKPPQ